MKYMGSKRSMLKNGLGELLIEKGKQSNTIFDPFSGSGSVVWFIANNLTNKIVAGDLQSYAVDLANAVLLQFRQMVDRSPLDRWLESVQNAIHSIPLKISIGEDANYVMQSRIYCSQAPSANFITRAYGGYYFSPHQAAIFEQLRHTIPLSEPHQSIAKAALIIAATHCVASPGHTAQPFQPTISAIRYLLESWRRDPFRIATQAIDEIFSNKSNANGKAYISTALNLVDKANEGDLVFIDPPYSGVHYSRFYHVLETISRGYCNEISGIGRYPSAEERPRSEFSMKTTSIKALQSLLEKISKKKASSVITFPAGDCSNGLSGKIVTDISKQYFSVRKETITGTFSTLGGNKSHRPARQASEELVLILDPK